MFVFHDLLNKTPTRKCNLL